MRCKHDMEEGSCAICLHEHDVPVPRTLTNELRAAELFSYAADNPRWTKVAAMEHLGWSANQVTLAIRELRKVLAGDDLNVIVVYEDGDWYYKLVGDLDSAMPWAALRLKMVESQIHTIADVTASLVNATKPNSRDGRRARIIAAQVSLLSMQLEQVDGM